MNNCLFCEVSRAKVVAAVLGFRDFDAHAITEQLNKKFLPKYYILPSVDESKVSIMRYNPTPPHKPYLIYEKVLT